MNDDRFLTGHAEPQNCWEFWGCQEVVREQCYAYRLNVGKECWRVTESIVPKPEQSPRIKNQIPYCGECDWFKKIKPDFVH